MTKFTILKKHLLHWLILLKQKQRIRKNDIALFLRQFATLLAAGIPIIQSCTILEKGQQKETLRSLICGIKNDLLAGQTLSHGLKSYAHYFDVLTCQLIHIGECTGKLDTMLAIIAHYQERQLAFRKRIKQALFYPTIITITALVVTFSMLMFVVPKFAELFQHTQNKLPFLTVFIFSLSEKLNQYALLLLTSIFLGIFFAWYNQHLLSLKKWIVTTITQLPLIQSCQQKIALAQFSRQLAITLAANIPLLEGLRLSTNIQLPIAQLRSQLCTGLQLHQSMETLSYFPPLMIQMIKIGEESGKLHEMLDKTADFFESEIDQLLSYLSQLLEPLIMIILGVLIGCLVIGMYLPIFKLGNTL